MDKTIAIIGAGQAGLLLAAKLLNVGYDVTLYSEKTPHEIRHGYVTSSQGLFASSLAMEREAGLNCFEQAVPDNTTISFTTADPEHHTKLNAWKGHTDSCYQAVDQRVKFSRWLDVLEQRGLKVNYQSVSKQACEKLVDDYDLVVVCTGKGELSRLFKRDEAKSYHQKPPRKLTLLYVHGLLGGDNSSGVAANFIPGVGEYFVMPGLTLSGRCHMMLFEAVPGGAFDCWDECDNNEAMLAKAKELLKEYLPWEYERCLGGITLTDEKAVIHGEFTPEIREPIATIKPGKAIFGLGDAVMLNDPITGQGGNNATRSVQIVFDEILKHQGKAFDTQWMQQTSDKCWEKNAFIIAWTNSFFEPPTEAAMYLMTQAQRHQEIADKLANAFDNPNTLAGWTESKQAIDRAVFFLKAQNKCRDKVTSFRRPLHLARARLKTRLPN